MKKMVALILVVVALLGVNAAAVSADSGSTHPSSALGGVFVPLGHGIDH